MTADDLERRAIIAAHDAECHCVTLHDPRSMYRPLTAAEQAIVELWRADREDMFQGAVTSARAIAGLKAQIEQFTARAQKAEAAIERVRTEHQPLHDPAGSPEGWQYCSCGAMESYVADDLYRAIRPARHPCATIRALDGTEATP